ncbi:MAG TPA: hypothetical protein VFP27_10180 [Mycobacterium sp.]|nr:hypothetical protein [Mycobacterium sp.]
MPKNFDEVLAIDADGRISPRGPLGSAAGEQVQKLYAWVFQLNSDGSGAVCAAAQAESAQLAGDEWTTRSDAIHEGRFKEGTAIGMAVTVSKDLESGKAKVYWWSETIYLKPEPP